MGQGLEGLATRQAAQVLVDSLTRHGRGPASAARRHALMRAFQRVLAVRERPGKSPKGPELPLPAPRHMHARAHLVVVHAGLAPELVLPVVDHVAWSGRRGQGEAAVQAGRAHVRRPRRPHWPEHAASRPRAFHLLSHQHALCSALEQATAHRRYSPMMRPDWSPRPCPPVLDSAMMLPGCRARGGW